MPQSPINLKDCLFELKQKKLISEDSYNKATGVDPKVAQGELAIIQRRLTARQAKIRENIDTINKCVKFTTMAGTMAGVAIDTAIFGFNPIRMVMGVLIGVALMAIQEVIAMTVEHFAWRKERQTIQNFLDVMGSKESGITQNVSASKSWRDQDQEKANSELELSRCIFSR
ncbi:MAG: hypothetical protein QM752_05355 [Gammaproteobacteria bacterium]